MAFLGPWSLYLGTSLPCRYMARHSTLTSVGFDVILALFYVGTAVLGLLRRELVVIALTAFASCVLLT